MAYNKNDLMNMDKTKLVEMLMTNQNALNGVISELQQLRSEISISDNIQKRIRKLETESYQAQQYSRRDSIEVNGLPESVKDEDLENKVVEILDKIGVQVSPNDIQACHRLRNKTRTIVKFTNRKNAYEARSRHAEIRNLDKASVGLPECKLYLNESLCPYYGMLLGKLKLLHKLKKINSFWVSNGSVRYNLVHEGRYVKVGHLEDLTNEFPEVNFCNP